MKPLEVYRPVLFLLYTSCFISTHLQIIFRINPTENILCFHHMPYYRGPFFPGSIASGAGFFSVPTTEVLSCKDSILTALLHE